MAYDRHTCVLCTLEWDSDTDALLCRVGDLLKQLVDNSNQAALLISELQKTTQRLPLDKDKPARAIVQEGGGWRCQSCNVWMSTHTEMLGHIEHHSEMYRLAQDIAKS